MLPHKLQITTIILWLIFTFAAKAQVDVSGLELFWKTADILSEGKSLTDKQWETFLNHRGYLITEQKGGRHFRLRKCMPLVFNPSLKDSLDIVLSEGPRRIKATCNHLKEAKRKRDNLIKFEQDLKKSAIVEDGVRLASKYLPVNATAGEVPKVYVILFEQNGFGGTNIAVDALLLMQMNEQQRTHYLGHEFYHSYNQRFDELTIGNNNPERLMVHTLSKLAEEGIASMIDKQEWTDKNEIQDLEGFWSKIASEFHDLYGMSNEILKGIDSTLVEYAKGNRTAEESGSQLNRILPWSGHPTGLYMAEAIENAHGRDFLKTLGAKPINFIAEYQKIALENDELYAFSKKSMDLIQKFAEKYSG